MKTIKPIRTRYVTLDDLFPTGAELMVAAYESMAGDEATCPEGRHGGRNPDRLDMAGISKREVYRRALANDLAWFEAHAAAIGANPFTWPPSLRTWVPKDPNKPEKGKRPIDDPPEIKRLVAIFVRAKLKEKIGIRLTDGQMGTRVRKFKNSCKRKGTTPQDMVALEILASIKQGLPVCVLVDLRNAFGEVPEILTLRELQSMGHEPDAARFVWSLVRIFAVEHPDDPPITCDDMGIEQGNPLSAEILDLVLAPVLRRVEARGDVRPFSYLDDAYLMTTTWADANAVFTLFRDIAVSMGFHNVRPLWVPCGREPLGKNSQIVDGTTDLILVLKTFLIDLHGISLTLDKEREFLEFWGPSLRRMTMHALRKATHCQALTDEATRARNNLLVRRAANPVRPATQTSPATESFPPPSGSSTSSRKTVK